jgi:hypothetical protein
LLPPFRRRDRPEDTTIPLQPVKLISGYQLSRRNAEATYLQTSVSEAGSRHVSVTEEGSGDGAPENSTIALLRVVEIPSPFPAVARAVAP